MSYKFETLQVHGGQEEPDSRTGARAVPIYQTTSYVFENSKQAEDRFGLRESGNIYSRLTNPTWDVLEKRIAALEGGSQALAVASGSAALTYTILNLAQAGDHIVATDKLYGGSYNLLESTLPQYGISTTFVEGKEVEDFKQAIKENTKAILIESLGNPNSDVLDIEKIADLAHDHGIPLIVDNTFATPYLLRPLEHGADIVVESATKFIGGQGSTLGGLIIEGKNFNWKSDKFPLLANPDDSYHGVCFGDLGPGGFVTRIRAVLLRDTGAALSPINAFLLIQGLETLSLRVERHVENALKVVDFLKNHPQVDRVNHPLLEDHPDHEQYNKYFPQGGGSIFTFNIKGGEKEAKTFIDSLNLFSLLANVADVKSLVIHPASTTHSQTKKEELEKQGILENTIRLSIGIEHIDDIIGDLQQGFEAVKELK